MKKIKNIVGTVLSAPSVLKSKAREAQSNADADAIKSARAAKGTPKLGSDNLPTAGFKAQVVGQAAKERILKRARKMTSDGYMPLKASAKDSLK